MKLFEVCLTRNVDLLVAGESENEVVEAVMDADLDDWGFPDWQVYATDLIENARTEQACDRLLAGKLPHAVVQDGTVMALDDVPGVMAVIEQAIRDRKAKIYMDEHQMKLPGFE